jgi:tellurite resistance protein
MGETMETHEHAEAAAHGGRRHTALLISVLAAGLAFCEQGAQHANTRMSESSVAAADLWAEYQAKSTRANETRDLAQIAALLPSAKPEDAAAIQARFAADIARFEADPKSGKAAVADRARAQEHSRDLAHEKLEAFDNAAAALQLAIVLTTASVITGSAVLVWGGALLGVFGGVLALLGIWAPQLAGL